MIEVKALTEHELERVFHLKKEYLDDDPSKGKCESEGGGLFPGVGRRGRSEYRSNWSKNISDGHDGKHEAIPSRQSKRLLTLVRIGATIRYPLSSIPYLKPFTYDELMSVTRLLLAKTESSGL